MQNWLPLGASVVTTETLEERQARVRAEHVAQGLPDAPTPQQMQVLANVLASARRSQHGPDPRCSHPGGEPDGLAPAG